MTTAILLAQTDPEDFGKFIGTLLVIVLIVGIIVIAIRNKK